MPSDACYYNPEYGVLQVSYDRRKIAQHLEYTFWVGEDATVVSI